MQLIAIEPTPNPNSMKLNLDTALPAGASLHFAAPDPAAPAYVNRLLAIPGVRSVYQVADFIALERRPQAGWQPILAAVREVLAAPGARPAAPSEPVRVYVQVFRGIPIQVKAVAGTREVRLALAERFRTAAMQAADAAGTLLAERRWEEQDARGTDPEAAAAAVAAAVDAAYPAARLEHLLAGALQQAPAVAAPGPGEPDWRRRYAALDQLSAAPGALPVVLRALADPHPRVRRLAAVYLGEIGGQAGSAAVLPHLLRALRDPAAAVRRAAGDALSDLGDPAAGPAMAAALADASKLVRWRAARFLYEAGDAAALPALQAAQDDPEFEVRLQVRMAIERIATGTGAVEPAWKQLTRKPQ